MTMLQLREVVDRGVDRGGRLTVIHVFEDGRIAVMALDNETAWPEIMIGIELEEEVDRGEAILLDPVLSPSSMRIELTDAEKSARDRRWAVIQPLVAQAPKIFDPKERARLIRALPAEAGSAPSIRSWLRSYWRFGMTPAALVGAWQNCGAKGVPRDEGEVKRGRARKYGSLVGVNLNRPLRLLITKVIWSQYRKDEKFKLTDAYREVCSRYFYEGDHDEEQLRVERKLKPEFEKTGPITQSQFDKHFTRWIDGLGLRRERRGARIWDTTGRGLPGTATAETRGPGSRYAIDATILNAYVRSRLNRNRIVGRAVLYVVIDVWSRLIVGIYVGVENASWACAMMALANVVEDKVEYCGRYGIPIERHEWPDSGIGERILSDGGEMTAEVADQLALHFNMKIETASAYRGDLKGVVENVFNVVPTVIGAYVPGWIQPDFLQRGAKDYRLESALDIDEITQMIIFAVIHRNNNVPIKNYDRDVGMPAADVASFPVDLWSYGIANRTGRFVRWPTEFVRFHLMPEADAVVDAHGLRFRGAWYLSDGMFARNWLAIGRKKTFKVRVSFDPRCAGSVYLHLENTEFGFELCRLNQERSRAFADPENEPSFWDLDLEEHDRKAMLADAVERETRSGIETVASVKGIAANAVARQTGSQGVSDAAQKRGIRENREMERALTQALDAAQFAPERPTPSPEEPDAGTTDEAEADYEVDIFAIIGEDQ